MNGKLDVLAVVLVFRVVAAVLPREVDLVLLGVPVIEIVGRHPQHLRDGDQEVQQVNHLDPGVLLVDLLILPRQLPVSSRGNSLTPTPGAVRRSCCACRRLSGDSMLPADERFLPVCRDGSWLTESIGEMC